VKKSIFSIIEHGRRYLARPWAIMSRATSRCCSHVGGQSLVPVSIISTPKVYCLLPSSRD